MQIISDELEAIAAELDLIYIRAINAADLNQRLQNVKVEKPILVYANLTPAEFPAMVTNFEYYTAEIEIFILDLSKSPDPTAAEIDAQLQPLFTTGNYIYDLLTRSGIIYSGADIERGEMTPAETIERTDEVLNGWSINLSLPISRNSYFCGV